MVILLPGLRAAAVLFLSLVAAAAPAQDVSKPESRRSRAILMECAGTSKFKVEVTTNPKAPIIDQYEASWSERWLDEVEPGDPGKGLAQTPRSRTWLEDQLTKKGQNADSGLAGVEARFTWKDGDPEVTIKSPRRVLQTHISRMRRQAACVGMELPIPHDPRIGRKYDFVCPAFIETFNSFDGSLEETKGTLTLDRLTHKGQRAGFSGEISFRASMEDRGLITKTEMKSKITIDWDVAARLPSSILVDGTTKVVASGSIVGVATLKSQMKITVTARTAADSLALKAAPVQFRDRTHKLADIECRIPSYWMVMEDTPRERIVLMDSRFAEDVTLALDWKNTFLSLDVPNADEGFADQFRQKDSAAKVARATTPLGKGYTFELTDAGRSIKGVAGPVGDSTLLVQIASPASVVHLVQPELDKLLTSVKKIVKPPR